MIERSAFVRALDVNVVGAFLGMQYAIPPMLVSNGGAVLNGSSTIDERAAAGDPCYPMSKDAIRGLTQSAALSCA